MDTVLPLKVWKCIFTLLALCGDACSDGACRMISNEMLGQSNRLACRKVVNRRKSASIREAIAYTHLIRHSKHWDQRAPLRRKRQWATFGIGPFEWAPLLSNSQQRQLLSPLAQHRQDAALHFRNR